MRAPCTRAQLLSLQKYCFFIEYANFLYKKVKNITFFTLVWKYATFYCKKERDFARNLSLWCTVYSVYCD